MKAYLISFAAFLIVGIVAGLIAVVAMEWILKDEGEEDMIKRSNHKRKDKE